MIHRQLCVPPTQSESHNPIHFCRIGLVVGLPVGKEVDVPKEHDLMLREIEVGVGDIPNERLAGVVRPGKLIIIVKKPTTSSIGREVLIRQRAPPSWEILYCLGLRSYEDVGVGLRDSAPADRRVAFVLQVPAEMVHHPGEGVGAVPLAQFDSSVRSIGEKVLVGIEGEVLLVEIGLQMEHATQSHEAGVVGSCREDGIGGKGAC